MLGVATVVFPHYSSAGVASATSQNGLRTLTTLDHLFKC